MPGYIFLEAHGQDFIRFLISSQSAVLLAEFPDRFQLIAADVFLDLDHPQIVYY